MDIVYLRVSTKAQEEKLQLSDILSLDVPAGYKVIKEKKSAWTENTRQGMDEMTRYISSGIVRSIYVWSLDRLFRDNDKLKEFIDICRQHGTIIYSFREKYLNVIFDNIPDGLNRIIYDMMVQVIAWQANDESNKISGRVKRAVVRTKNGTYSYNNKKWGKEPIAKKIRLRIKRLYKKKMSVRKIAKIIDKSSTFVHSVIHEPD